MQNAKNVKIVIDATAVDDCENRLVLVRRGRYMPTKNGLRKALRAGFADKYNTVAPFFSVTNMSPLPSVKKDVQRFSVSFKKGNFPVMLGFGGVEYNAVVVFKA